MLDRLANLTGTYPKRVIAVAVILFALAGFFGSGVADRLDPYSADDPDTESVIAQERLEDAGYRETSAVVLIEGVNPESATGAQRVEEVATATADVEGVRDVTGFLDTDDAAFVSRAGDTTYLAVTFEATDDDEVQETGEVLVAALEDTDGVSVGGNAVAQQQVNEKVESDLQRAELLAFPILFVLSLLFFRSLVAAALPLLIGALAIVSTLLLRPWRASSPRSRSSRSTWSRASAWAWRSTTACSSSRATARRSRAPAPASRPCAAPWRRPDALSCSRR